MVHLSCWLKTPSLEPVMWEGYHHKNNTMRSTKHYDTTSLGNQRTNTTPQKSSLNLKFRFTQIQKFSDIPFKVKLPKYCPKWISNWLLNKVTLTFCVPNILSVLIYYWLKKNIYIILTNVMLTSHHNQWYCISHISLILSPVDELSQTQPLHGYLE